jgi:alanine racemase
VFETSYIELDRDALKANLRFIRNHIGTERKLSYVVKGNAYGHGIEEYVPLAESAGIDHFSVYSADEAVRVHRVKKPETEIMIMGAVDDEGLEWAIQNGIEVWIFEIERLNKALEIAKRSLVKVKIHLELETGMHRTGFNNGDLKQAISKLKENKVHFILKGLCTHFAGAESIANFYRVKEQIKTYRKLVKKVEQTGLIAERKHTCCSAAALRFPEMMLDMVRIGILQYGFWPSMESFIEYSKGKSEKEDPLKRLISWKSRLMSIKQVKTGDYVGYGTSYLAQRDTLMGIVPVGYGHGFTRSLSNQGRAIINGTRVQVIGTVNMNCIAIDLSDVHDPTKGDTVTLIGCDGDLELSVASFSEATNQVNYELLTRLPMNIPRITV